MTRTQTLPPNPARLIEGLRDTGYDFNTALADIVDNSIDAGATRIDVRIKMDTDGDVLITVADNGCGMDEQTLLDGMTYGATGHIDPKRLGKFGLGLKTASTAFCRKLSVITRNSSDAGMMKATWDLDHVVKVAEWELLLDAPNSFERELLEEVAQNTSGTLVVWEEVDRLLRDYQSRNGRHARSAIKKIVNGFRAHASMIYQRFLDMDDNRARSVEVLINGFPIEPWDPFCKDEPETELVATEEEVKVEFNERESSFSIHAYVLPRKESFSTPAAHQKAKLSNDMQGIYIYRENRLIHFADWLGMFRNEPHGTLLRVEFSFDHTLDDAFNVDIKKSRILLKDGLYNWIKERFLPAPRNAANERYRTGTRKKISEQAAGAHADSNRNISSKETDLINSEIKITDPTTGEVEITNKYGKVQAKLSIVSPSAPGQVSVQPVDSIQDGLLWKPAIIHKHHAVQINNGHPYYHKVYVPNLSASVTIQGMDSLLWALAEAELSTINDATKNHFEELRFEVSRLLRKLVEDLPEPELDSDP